MLWSVETSQFKVTIRRRTDEANSHRILVVDQELKVLVGVEVLERRLAPEEVPCRAVGLRVGGGERLVVHEIDFEELLQRVGLDEASLENGGSVFLKDEVRVDPSVQVFADEIFVCGTGVQVSPVSSVDRRPVGTGKPGPFSMKLQALYLSACRGEHEKYRDWVTPVY